ncbi:MAG TPA: tetratricopeptide repeat protein [Thermodesulfobacteriota bacterium]|nr:tetratricopeptide repeat protein [Deltaproteobacteria bacterium]HNR12430.1 tetratricopeptide repeat protein [Thermodesulfobacteriota bacterium]HNU70458.1 tetratricopeptide repeat protein [Thermodesulfobacteriota bacterium]HOC38767.1 tetratricopeptide repeat protein [Thermodesulfobacteriota bacterium]
MGYVLLQYHDKVGWEVNLEEYVSSRNSLEKQKSGTGQKTVHNPTLDMVDVMIRDGQIEEAIGYIREQIESAPTDLNLAGRYYKLLKAKQSVPEMLEHAKRYLDILFQTKQGETAYQVYTECAAKDPQFTPFPAAHFKIAGLLNKKGNYKGAINAYNRFVKANPHDAQVPRAYFLASTILHERLNNSQKAREVLSALLKRYPSHDIVPDVENYLGRLKA